jgi:signal transduction histidine kinase
MEKWMSYIVSVQEALKKAEAIIASTKDGYVINDAIETIVKEVTHAEFASVWIYEAPCLRRERKGGEVCISMDTKEGLLYKCFATQQVVLSNYLSSEKGFVPHVDNPDGIQIKSKIMIPLTYEGKFLGIVTAYSSVKNIRKFSQQDIKLFQAITPFITEALLKLLHVTNETHLSHGVATATRNLEEIQHQEVPTQKQEIKDIASIVHDIKTPANALSGFLEILHEHVEDARLRSYITNAFQSAQLINELTASILNGTQNSAQNQQTQKEKVATQSFFAQIGEMFSAQAYDKKISYNIFIDPFAPKEILVDTMQLRRVIMNLIANALKFTQEGGSIEFSVRFKPKEQLFHIFVKDSGIGIAKEKHAQILKPFVQADADVAKTYGGYGLGLSICSGYIQQMGGKLQLESDIGQGSVFYFDLPLEIVTKEPYFSKVVNDSITVAIVMQKENSFVANHIGRYLMKIGLQPEQIKAVAHHIQIPQEATHVIAFENRLCGDFFMALKEKKLPVLVVEEQFLKLQEENLEGAGIISCYTFFGERLYDFIAQSRKPRVLIVEDDAISITLLENILHNEYCRIESASDGEEGLFMLREACRNHDPFDVVFTDNRMPKLTGEEMLKRYLDSCKEAKITTKVSISGQDVDTDAYDVIATKPFRKKEIIQIFQDAVAKRS